MNLTKTRAEQLGSTGIGDGIAARTLPGVGGKGAYFVRGSGHDKHAGYDDTFTPITFSLNNLSTLPDENGDYTLSADAGQGGKLRWKAWRLDWPPSAAFVATCCSPLRRVL